MALGVLEDAVLLDRTLAAPPLAAPVLAVSAGSMTSSDTSTPQQEAVIFQLLEWRRSIQDTEYASFYGRGRADTYAIKARARGPKTP